MNDDILGLLKFVSAIFGFAFVLVGLIVAFVAAVNYRGCNDLAALTDLETRWTFALGCYVKAPNGEWMSDNAYNSRHIQNRHQLEIK